MDKPKSLQYVVLEKANRQHEMYEGGFTEVARWLLHYPAVDELEVYDRVNNRYTPAELFASQFLTPAMPVSTEGMSRDVRMRHEDLHDPFIHARNEMVRQWIARAIRSAKNPDCDHEHLTESTTQEVIRLFY